MTTAFMRISSDGFLRVDRILSIGREKTVEGRALPLRRINLTGEGHIDIESCEIDALMKRPVQLIPARPGWKLLHFDVEGDPEPALFHAPLIAWALCVDGEVRPLTPAGIDDGVTEPDRGWYVEDPTGHVHAANSWASHPAFDSAADALKHFVERWRAMPIAERAQEA